MGGFLGNMFDDWGDILSNALDPRDELEGLLRGGLRSAVDIGSQLDPFPYLYRGAWALGVPGADELLREQEERKAKAQEILDEKLGPSLGRRLIGEPVQEAAEKAIGYEYGRPVGLGEFIRPSFEELPGDIPPTQRETTRGPFGEISTRERPTTPEDIEREVWLSKQIGGLAESAGGLVESAPELAAIPSAPGAFLAFLPGIAESLGEHLGRGEYGSSLLDLGLLGAGTLHTGRLGRGVESRISPERIEESRMPRMEDVTPEAALPQTEPVGGNVYREALGNEPIYQTREFARNILNQVKDIIEKEEVGAFPTEGSKAEFLRSVITPEEAGPGTFAQFRGTPGLSEAVKYNAELGAEFDLKHYLDFVGETKIAPDSIAKSSANPTDFVHNLVGALAHETGGHVVSGQHIPEVKPFWDRRFQEDVPKPRSIADYPPEAQTLSEGEFAGQIQTDIVRDRMLQTPLVQNLLETSSDPMSPISRIWEQLSGKEIPTTSKFGFKETPTVSLPVGEGPEAKKQWRITFNDGSTKFVEAADRLEAATVVRKEGLPKGATKIAGISERTPEMIEGVTREGIRARQTTFDVKLSDGTTRKVRSYSEEGARKLVEKAQEEGGTGLKVTDISEREITKPAAPGPKTKLTPEEIYALGKVLGERRKEAPEITQAREAVMEAITGKPKVEPREPSLSETIARKKLMEGKSIKTIQETFRKGGITEKETLDMIQEKIKGEAKPPKPPKPPKRREPPREEPPEENVERLKKGLLDDITDIPKTFKFAFDISWPGRQGLFLLNRPEALKGMIKGTATAIPFKGRELHERIKAELDNRPNAELYKKIGLNQYIYDPTEITSISQRMEEIPSERAARLPGIRHSTRAFEDAGNLARANMVDKYVEDFTKAGKTFEIHPELYKGMAEYLNVLTMRKPLPQKLQQAAWILNKMFVSPMAVYSRLNMLNPAWYNKLPTEMKRAAFRDIGGTTAAILGLMGAVKIAAVQAGYDEDEVDLKLDPAHTDFGKLKIGKTTYDFFAGLLQPIRTTYRVVTGRKATRKGEYALPGSIMTPSEELEKAPFGQTAFSELMRFGEQKMAPLYHAIKGVTTGRGWYGQEYGFAEMLKDLFLPLSIEEPLEAQRLYGPEEALKQAPGVVGVGTQVEFPEDKKESGQLEYPF